MPPIGRNIKALRESAGMTQEALAQVLGISRPAVTEIEKGTRKVSADELVRLSKALRVSTDFILGLGREPRIDLAPEPPPASRVRPAVRISVPKKNVAKFKEVLLYILGCVGAKPNIGETVLYKLLYFIDFDHYEKYEEQLIGATYQRNRFGPTPMEFKAIVQRMVERGEIACIQKPYFSYRQKKYLPLREPDLSKISGRELELINDVLRRLSDMSATQISEYSHKDVPWLTTDNEQIIPYEAVFYRTPEYSVRADKDDEDEVS